MSQMTSSPECCNLIGRAAGQWQIVQCVTPPIIRWTDRTDSAGNDASPTTTHSTTTNSKNKMAAMQPTQTNETQTKHTNRQTDKKQRGLKYKINIYKPSIYNPVQSNQTNINKSNPIPLHSPTKLSAVPLCTNPNVIVPSLLASHPIPGRDTSAFSSTHGGDTSSARGHTWR